MLKSGQKWSKSVPQRQKSMSNSMSNSVSNFISQKWTEKAENDSKGTEIGKIDKNQQKSTKIEEIKEIEEIDIIDRMDQISKREEKTGPTWTKVHRNPWILKIEHAQIKQKFVKNPWISRNKTDHCSHFSMTLLQFQRRGRFFTNAKFNSV